MHSRLTASCFALCAALSATSAFAQQKGGFSLDRFDPSERGSDWFSQESLDLRGHVRPALGLVLDYAHNPLVLYDNNGDTKVASIVANQMFLHVGGSLVLWDRLRLGANLPVALMNNGDSGVLGTQQISGARGAGVGDLRLGADVRLLGEYGQAFNLAVGAQVHVPTGSKDAFTSDGKVRVVPRLLAAGDIGSFAYAANVRVNVRPSTDTLYGKDYQLGTELGFGASAGLRLLDKKLIIGPEIYGSTVTADAFSKKTTPFEVIIGGHYRAGDFRFGLGAGPGLSRGLGAPDVRVLANLEWFPEVETKEAVPADRDGDGITDDKDACPDVAGVSTNDPKTNGCPPPKDTDGDGILDEQDACPNEKGVPSDDPKKNGCPAPKDADGDGILDEKDACPTEPGLMNDDPKKNGCPPPKDTDGDGITDDVDACPAEKGVASEDPKKNGCPKARLVGKKIEILERIEFDTAKATIRPESEGVLNAVLGVLKDYPGIKKLDVEGHTDNKGARGTNVALSKNRAASVVKWLVAHGIDAKRLTSHGYGPDKPRDTNDTDAGRQNNRRVEFNIVEGSAEKTVEVSGDHAAEPADQSAAPVMKAPPKLEKKTPAKAEKKAPSKAEKKKTP